MSDIAYWLQDHTGNPSVILFTNAICNWYNKMPFFFMNKCCGSAQKIIYSAQFFGPNSYNA